MKDSIYIKQLVTGWEEVYKRGQLTLWILLALKDGPKHMGQVRAFITKATNGVLTVDDKSLYRALRRYHSAELVDFTTEPGKGPDKKVYRLSPVGKEVLAQFITRNIKQTLLAPANRALIERNYHD